MYCHVNFRSKSLMKWERDFLKSINMFQHSKYLSRFQVLGSMLLLKVLKQGCRKWGGPQFLADQLTLSQPGGGTLSPLSTRSPPPDFQTLRRPCQGTSKYILPINRTSATEVHLEVEYTTCQNQYTKCSKLTNAIPLRIF